MAYWLGFLMGHFLDPISFVIAYMVFIFSEKAQTKTRFLIAFVIACIIAFLSGWLASSVSGIEGTLKISNFLGAFIAFIMQFSIIYLIGALIKK